MHAGTLRSGARLHIPHGDRRQPGSTASLPAHGIQIQAYVRRHGVAAELAAQAKATAACLGASVRRSSAVDEVHQPACDDDGSGEEHKAIDAVAHHGTRFAPLRDTEDSGCKEREEQHGREVGGAEDQDFLPMRMLCASTAAMTFSRPATTMNLVP